MLFMSILLVQGKKILTSKLVQFYGVMPEDPFASTKPSPHPLTVPVMPTVLFCICDGVDVEPVFRLADDIDQAGG